MLFLNNKCSITILIIWVYLSRAEIYTSVQHLRKAFHFERKIVNALYEYVSETEQIVDIIKRYLQSYEDVEEERLILVQRGSPSKTSEIDVEEKLAGNPLQVFHLMKRLSIDRRHLMERNPLSSWKGVLEVIENENELSLSNFSDEEDLKGVTNSLVVLQSFYKLNISDLVKGNISGVQTTAKLSAFDCFYLGVCAHKQKFFRNSVIWLEKAYNLAVIEEDETVPKEIVLHFLRKVYKQFFGFECPENTLPFFSEKLSSLSDILDEESKEKFIHKEIETHQEAHRNFEALCRGEQFLSDKYIAELKCFYDTRNSPYFVLMPAKVEQKHINPDILVFHDAIRDGTMTLLKTLSEPMLSRGRVYSVGEKVQNETSHTRTSKVTWLDFQFENEEFGKMVAYIEALTGLVSRGIYSSEPLQIANYGTGGFYNPHMDFLVQSLLISEHEKKSGNRVATFMFYLSDVEKGGSTAFPHIGVSITPEKGSAAFWYNIRKSSLPDMQTFHGGCPVLVGSKWVANKWIRENDQIFKRPCGVSIFE